MKALPLPPAWRLRVRENQVFLVVTIVVGVLAGLSAVLFSVAIEQTSHRLFGLAPSPWRLLAVPFLVSLVTGVLLAKVFPDVRGSGVPQTEAAYHLSRGVIPPHVPLGKFITGVLSIGSGHSMGREGPSVQIGAGLASVIGRWLQLSPECVRDLVPVGAAGALAAAFNTPIAAVLFALEEIIGDLNATLLGSTVLASVAAVSVERAILGNEPLFHVPAYHLVNSYELLAYAGLGIVGGVVSLIFSKSLLSLRRFFLSLPVSTRIIQPAIGGLIIGGLLLVAPAVMGVGYEYVDQALNGGLALRMLVLLCALKLVATLVSYTSGNAGGIFGPSLYIGAMAGGAIGTLVHTYAPFPTADPGAYALVGMGTLFAGIIRAPMTSVFMIFEITQDYQILVPLMVANMLSFAISRRYQPNSIYHALLLQDDVHLPAAGVRDNSRAMQAVDVMRRDVTLVSPDATIEEAERVATAMSSPMVLVARQGHLLGTVAESRLARSIAEGQGARPVGGVVEMPPVDVVHADHPLDIVIERFARTDGALPVVSRSDATRVEGVITLDSIIDFVARRHEQERARPPARN
jgi:chloride channel protein, CIC family